MCSGAARAQGRGRNHRALELPDLHRAQRSGARAPRRQRRRCAPPRCYRAPEHTPRQRSGSRSASGLHAAFEAVESRRSVPSSARLYAPLPHPRPTSPPPAAAPVQPSSTSPSPRWAAGLKRPFGARAARRSPTCTSTSPPATGSAPPRCWKHRPPTHTEAGAPLDARLRGPPTQNVSEARPIRRGAALKLVLLRGPYGTPAHDTAAGVSVIVQAPTTTRSRTASSRARCAAGARWRRRWAAALRTRTSRRPSSAARSSSAGVHAPHIVLMPPDAPPPHTNTMPLASHFGFPSSAHLSSSLITSARASSHVCTCRCDAAYVHRDLAGDDLKHAVEFILTIGIL